MRRMVVVAWATALAMVGLVALPAAAGAGPGPGAQKRALIVGVTQYQPPTHHTEGGAGDAVATRDLLLANGWSADNVRMLVDGDATGDAIRAGLDWLASGSGPSTFSVFHYSGHTRQQQLPPGQTDDEQYHEFLWSVDNQFISDRELSSQLTRVQGTLWADIAGCEAAGFDDGISAPNRLVTAASQESEKAYEIRGSGRSIFSELMVGALSHGASIQQAFASAAATAPSITANQQPYGPQNPYMAGGDSADWFLQPPAAPGLLDGLLPPGLLPPGLLDGLLPPGLLPPGLLTPQTPG